MGRELLSEDTNNQIALQGKSFAMEELVAENFGIQAWRGRELDSGRAVFIKLAPGTQVDPKRLEHEARTLEQLDSKRFPRILAFGACDGRAVLVSGWVEGPL